MTIQYLLVTFPEQCNVLADGAAVGVTNHVLMLPGDEYQITLSSGNSSPTSQDIALVGTSLVKPLVVAFATTAESLVSAAAKAKADPKPARKKRARQSKPATKARTNE